MSGWKVQSILFLTQDVPNVSLLDAYAAFCFGKKFLVLIVHFDLLVSDRCLAQQYCLRA